MSGKNLASAIINNLDFAQHYQDKRFWQGKIDHLLVKSLFSWEHLNHIFSTARITNID